MKAPRSASADYHVPFMVQLVLPSLIGAFLCIFVGVVIIATHLLLISLHQGTLFPELFDGQWAVVYTNGIVGPVSAFFGSRALNVIAVGLLWGLVGAFAYQLATVGLRVYNEWREVEHGVRINADNEIVQHPLRRSFILGGMWRTLIVMLAVTAAAAARPLFHYLLAQSQQLAMAATPAFTNLRTVCTLVLAWAFIAHMCVVFARLFVLRTRL